MLLSSLTKKNHSKYGDEFLKKKYVQGSTELGEIERPNARGEIQTSRRELWR